MEGGTWGSWRKFSAGDSDTLDGIDSGSFLRSDATDSFTGTITNNGVFVSYHNNNNPGTNLKLGRSSSQYYTIHGGSSGNFLTSVTSSSNPKANLQFAYSVDGGSTRANSYTLNGSSGTIWHTGNDGAGSGLDADTLDGIDSGSFLRSDVNDIYEGQTSGRFLSFRCVDGRSAATTSGSQFPLEVKQNTSGADAAITFHVSGDYAGYFGLDGTANDLFWGGWSRGAAKYKIWHAANDGSGSGLDADLLDGKHRPNNFGNSSGQSTYITNANLDTGYNVVGASVFYPAGGGSITGDPTASHSGNGYLFTMGMGDNSGRGAQILASSGGNQEFYFRTKVDAGYQAWRKVWHDANDGSGSGLDADTVDGIQASSFLRSDASDTTTGSLTVNGVVICNEIRDRSGSQLVLNAGEAEGKFSGQTGEWVYVNAEGGLFVSTPDSAHGNFESGYTQDSTQIKGRSIGVKTSPGGNLNGRNACIALGDSDTGIAQNGDGQFEIWANNQEICNFDSSEIEALKDINQTNGNITTSGNIFIRNGGPTIYLRDTNHRSSMVHCNSNLWYVLRGSGNDSTTWQTTGGQWPLVVNLENNNVTIGGNGYVGGTTIITSDERLKTDIQPITGALEKVKALRGVTYYRTDIEPDKLKSGLIAQEVEPILPHIVDENVQQDPGTGEVLEDTRFKGLAYEELHPYLIEAIKEQQALIEALTARIEALENP
jgi:hypothetical protein